MLLYVHGVRNKMAPKISLILYSARYQSHRAGFTRGRSTQLPTVSSRQPVMQCMYGISARDSAYIYCGFLQIERLLQVRQGSLLARKITRHANIPSIAHELRCSGLDNIIFVHDLVKSDRQRTGSTRIIRMFRMGGNFHIIYIYITSTKQ